MFKNRTRMFSVAAIACAVFIQLVVVISLLTYTVRTRHYAQKNGRIICLECKATDPFNPFKGRYVRLSFAERSISKTVLDSKSFEDLKKLKELKAAYHAPVYLKMEQAEDNLWTVHGIRQKLPKNESDIYIKARVSYISEESVSVEHLFTDYYLQENYARFVDKIHWEDFNNLKPVLALYVDKNGKCIQKDLTVFDGKERISIEEYCKRMIPLT